MLYGLLKTAHVLAIIIWIGGMLFSRNFLAPAAAKLDLPIRAPLMQDALGRFFRVVSFAIIIALVSGIWMTGRVAKQAIVAGVDFSLPMPWVAMMGLGFVMAGFFLLIRVSLYPRLVKQVADSDWEGAAKSLVTLRNWVGANLAIGLLIVIVMGVGMYL
ncbi:MAG: CopD family protein [Gammaproteobacteria bacterium]|nr:CopD family protein [Gammaproteobacteria bacterium]